MWTMSDLTAVLLEMQRAINQTIREEVGHARREFRQGLEHLDERQAEDRAAQAVDRAALVSLQGVVAKLDERTKLTSRGLLSALTAKQKAALWTFGITAGGAIVDGIRHLVALAKAAIGTGVHP
jgi:hypothetical protein